MLQNKTSKLPLFLGGCAVGAVAFLLLFTAAPLCVTNDSWLCNGFVEKDIIQHYTGWLFFRESPLTFPLGFAQNINYPNGSAVTFTDSIPLFAIFFRLFSGILPETFQYFGIYAFVCFILQGGAAALLLSLFTKNIFALFCGTVLFVWNPIFIERTFRHTALGAHFLILFALYLYFLNKKEGFAYRPAYLILLGVAVTIHPYFLPILFGILFADLLEEAVPKKTYRKPALFLGAGFLVVLIIGCCIGIFSVPASGRTLAGYGYFPMNLNALWTPNSAGGLVWSSVLPSQNQALGSYEGFNYLGLGVLVAAPLCLVQFLYQHRKTLCEDLRKLLHKHFGLAFVCTCLTLFALSTTWMANGAVLFSIPLPRFIQSLCDIFRASGRMFWPVYYLIFLFVISAIANMPKRTLSYVTLALLLMVQVSDLTVATNAKRAFFTEETVLFPSPLQNETWDDIGKHYKHIFSLDDYLYDATSTALFAAEHGLTTNDGWTARFDLDAHREEVAEETKNILAGQLRTDTVYLTSDEQVFIPLAIATEQTAYAVRIDWHWYAIIPKVEGMPAPNPSDSLYLYPDLPILIPDASNDDFTDGISNTDPSKIMIFLNDYSAPKFWTATAIIADGVRYPILEMDYSAYYYFVFTLDIEDASVLKGKFLTTELPEG